MRLFTIVFLLFLFPALSMGQIQGFENSRIHTLSQLSTIEKWFVPTDSLEHIESIPPQSTTWKRSYLNVDEYKGHVLLYRQNPEENPEQKPFSEHIFNFEKYLIIDHTKNQALTNYAGINMPFIETSSRIFLQVPISYIVEEAQKKNKLKETETGYQIDHKVNIAGKMQPVTFLLDHNYNLIKGDDQNSQVEFEWTRNEEKKIDYAKKMIMTVNQQGQSMRQIETVKDIKFNVDLPHATFKIEYPDNYRAIDLRELLSNPNLQRLNVPKPSQK